MLRQYGSGLSLPPLHVFGRHSVHGHVSRNPSLRAPKTRLAQTLLPPSRRVFEQALDTR